MSKEEAPKLQFEFQLTLKKVKRRRGESEVPALAPPCHPVVRTLVLAHRIQGMIRDGQVRNLADAARWLGVTRSRVGQVASLLMLSPAIQEAVLVAAPERLDALTERRLCDIAAAPDWADQAGLWAKL